jgi:hypothetical protein
VVLVQILAQKDLCHIGFQLGCILFLAFHSMFETLDKTFCLTVGCRVEWGRDNMLDTISLQNSWNSSDVNCGPLSVTTCAGTKKYLAKMVRSRSVVFILLKLTTRAALG